MFIGDGVMSQERKVFLTYDEQIDLLESRGMRIPSHAVVRHYLQCLGYFELVNGYKDLFL